MIGEGGMIITDNEEYANQIKILGLHGMSKDAWKRFSDEGHKHYQVVYAGFKYNMMDLQTAIGMHQLPRVDKYWERRQEISRYVHGILLDIGSRDKSYENMIKPYVTQHLGLDQPNTCHDKSKIDLFETAYNIPINDESFDTILCTAVLEHLEEPDKAIEEANRVLKRSGYALYTVPLFWHLHEEPRDFYRYTKYGLMYLFDKEWV